jgi:hypothetical protein
VSGLWAAVRTGSSTYAQYFLYPVHKSFPSQGASVKESKKIMKKNFLSKPHVTILIFQPAKCRVKEERRSS